MEVTFDFGNLLTAAQGPPDYSPVAKVVVESSAVFVSAMHVAYTGTMLPGMTQPVNNTNAANAIHASIDGLFSFRVQTPDEPEQAVPAYDMKPGLLRGPKHRVTKDGRSYNIVPFIHKGAGLPDAVAQTAAQLSLSSIIGRRLEIRSDDQWEVMRNVYSWGSNLGKQENNRYSNMYRFGDDKYITFRTVSTRSAPDSWIHPGYAANPITEAAWSAVGPSIGTALALAWEKAVIGPWLS